MADVRMAIVGVGDVAQHQIDAIAATSNTTLVAACDIDAERLKTLPVSVNRFHTVDELLSESELDVVVVSTPLETHAPIARRVIDAGAGVLLEKPATGSLAEFDEMAAMASALDVYFDVAFHAQYGLETVWTSRWLLSRPDWVLSSFESFFHDPYASAGAVEAHRQALGGAWLDSGINALSVLMRFTHAEQMTVDDVTALFDSASGLAIRAHVNFGVSGSDDGVHGSIGVDWTQPTREKRTVLHFQTGETVVLDHAMEEVVISEPGHEVARTPLANGRPRLVNHYVGLFEATASALSAGVKPDLSVARNLHRLLLEGQKRIESCR